TRVSPSTTRPTSEPIRSMVDNDEGAKNPSICQLKYSTTQMKITTGTAVSIHCFFSSSPMAVPGQYLYQSLRYPEIIDSCLYGCAIVDTSGPRQNRQGPAE